MSETENKSTEELKTGGEPEAEETAAKPEEPAAEEPKEETEKPAEAEASEETGEPDPAARIAELEGQVAKLKNAYAMAYADTENTRKRLTKEYESNMKYHIQSFALEILPVLDNCERALALKAEDSNDENYRKGFEMVFRQLSQALKKEGVEEIEALDQEFDPNWMQAMMTEQVEGVEPGKVTAVLQKGYKLKDRLLRAAMVKVSE
ncbi:MAG: nucleotide exchange factor GrpE [Solobacterium sp.]|jgi:molecular chaperone GrpE|nr:nucleotide exchange factor GrpE [Solobacterium sp.]